MKLDSLSDSVYDHKNVSVSRNGTVSIGNNGSNIVQVKVSVLL